MLRRLMLNLSKALMTLQFLHRENFVKWQDDLSDLSPAKVRHGIKSKAFC